jgi:hypothetical protein
VVQQVSCVCLPVCRQGSSLVKSKPPRQSSVLTIPGPNWLSPHALNTVEFIVVAQDPTDGMRWDGMGEGNPPCKRAGDTPLLSTYVLLHLHPYLEPAVSTEPWEDASHGICSWVDRYSHLPNWCRGCAWNERLWTGRSHVQAGQASMYWETTY